jgi:hypothetical protein
MFIIKINNKAVLYKKAIIKIWLFGFLSDFIGTAFIFLSQLELGMWWREFISNPVSYNPFDNIFSLIFVLIAVIISALCIFIFNRYVSFNKTDMDKGKIFIISLILAIFTAPYLFLIPSQLLYSSPFNENNEIHFFTNHIVRLSQNQIDMTYKKDGESITVNLNGIENDEKIDYGNIYLFIKVINNAKGIYRNSKIDIREADYTLKFYRRDNTGENSTEAEPTDNATTAVDLDDNSNKKDKLTDVNSTDVNVINIDATIVSLWLEEGQQKALFKYNDSWYEADEEITAELYEIIKNVVKQQ